MQTRLKKQNLVVILQTVKPSGTDVSQIWTLSNMDNGH